MTTQYRKNDSLIIMCLIYSFGGGGGVYSHSGAVGSFYVTVLVYNHGGPVVGGLAWERSVCWSMCCWAW